MLIDFFEVSTSQESITMYSERYITDISSLKLSQIFLLKLFLKTNRYYRNKMMLSLNCLILGQASEKSFTEIIGEKYFDDDQVEIKFSNFTVSKFKEKLFRRKIVKDKVESPDEMDIWKVELDIKSFNNKIYTEDDIKNCGTKMEPAY